MIAHHWVAAPQGGVVARTQRGDGLDHGGADGRIAQVTTEQGVARGERPMGGQAFYQCRHFPGRQGAAGMGAMAGMVAELDGVDCQHLRAEALEGEDGCGIADMAGGHPGLDGEDFHHSVRQAAAKASIAQARWLVACFSAGSISP